MFGLASVDGSARARCLASCLAGWSDVSGESDGFRDELAMGMEPELSIYAAGSGPRRVSFSRSLSCLLVVFLSPY